MADAVIVDVATGKQTVRQLTAAEEQQRQSDIAAAQQQAAEEAARPDPVAELVAAVEGASTVAALKTALKTHLPRAFGRT